MLKLLWCHRDHVTRSALLFWAALETNGRGSFEGAKCADAAVTGGCQAAHDADHSLRLGFYLGFSSHRQAVPCVSDARCFLVLKPKLNLACIYIGLQTLSSVLAECVWQLGRPPPRLDLIPQALHTWTQGDSANLVCRSSKAPSGWRETVGWPILGLGRAGRSRTPGMSLSRSSVVSAYWGQCLIGKQTLSSAGGSGRSRSDFH